MVKEKTIHVWITHYALSKGIYERTAKSTSYPTMIVVAGSSSAYLEYYHKPNWHLTHKEAIARAEEMRLRKIASLEKQLAKVRALRFELRPHERREGSDD